MEAREDAIHEARGGGGSVAKTKWNLIEFVQLPTAGTKGGLLFIALLDWDLPVATLKVKRRKPPSSVKCVKEAVYPGQWVCVLDGSCVKLPKVDSKPKATVFFFTITTGEAHGLLEGRMMSLDLSHLLPSNSRVLSPVGLAKRRSVSLNGVPQQRSTAEIVSPLAEDVAEFPE